MDDLRELLWGTRFEFDHPPTAEEALGLLLELHGLHELDGSVAEALVTVARVELERLHITLHLICQGLSVDPTQVGWESDVTTAVHQLRAQAHLGRVAVRVRHGRGVLRCPACHVGTLWSDDEGVRCVIPAGPDAPHLMVDGCGHSWDSVGFPVDAPDAAPAETAELTAAYAESLDLVRMSPESRAALERLRTATYWAALVPAVAATVAVPVGAGRAAWEWMNATGEHHGSDLMPLRTVLDSHPLIGGCRDCRHGSDEHEPARFGGCKLCGCPDWIDPHPEEN